MEGGSPSFIQVISLESQRKITENLNSRFKSLTSRQVKVWTDFSDWLNRICFIFKSLSILLVHKLLPFILLEVLPCFGGLTWRKSGAEKYCIKDKIHFTLRKDHEKRSAYLIVSLSISCLNQTALMRCGEQDTSRTVSCSRISVTTRDNLTSHCSRHRCDGCRQINLTWAAARKDVVSHCKRNVWRATSWGRKQHVTHSLTVTLLRAAQERCSVRVVSGQHMTSF